MILYCEGALWDTEHSRFISEL
uniref:Uncharacterized protein n=1 Tax=Arundo donax TaxID=35708 RepID=A0A0A9E6B4_ARUDO